MNYLNHTTSRSWASWLTACVMALFMPLHAAAGLSERYTKEHPLIILGEWEMAPYEYSNIYGVASGYHIDLLDLILNRLNIPHQYVMKDWQQSAEAFERGEGQLIFDPAGAYRDAPYYSSRTVVADYRLKLAYKKGHHAAHSADELAGKKVIIRSNDLMALSALDTASTHIVPEQHSAKNALAGLMADDYDYFLWAEESLRWKIKEMGLDDHIVMCNFESPAYEIHFASLDGELINELDDQYARIDQNGGFNTLRDKWFHPERIHNDTSPVAIYIAIGILLFSVVLWLLIRVIIKRLRKVSQQNADMENMMREALSMSNYGVMAYHVKLDRFSNLHGSTLPEQGLTLSEFIERIHPDDQHKVSQEMHKLIAGKGDTWEMDYQWNAAADGTPKWIFIHGHAIAEKDDSNHTQQIQCTVKDVTKEFEQERKDSDLANKYAQLFEATLVGMSYYDKDGRLVELNENMRTLCGFDEEGENFFRKASLFEVPLFKDDVDPKNPYHIHACQHMHYAEAGLDKYIEYRILPTYDENGELQYYVVTARDITDEREMYMKQYRHDKELQKANAMTTQYEMELRYLLKNCDMWVWRSDLQEQTIAFSRSLKKADYKETFQEFSDSLFANGKAETLKAFNNLEGSSDNFNVNVHFKHTPANPKEQWMSISGIPVFNDDGTLKGHFGILRDITSLIEVQEKLKQETSRAEDSGKLKSVFLANMTHEIRTPLNAIVGFSDLLQVIDDPQERKEFIRIIRNNCDMLIRLIDDIIEASNMNQKALTIEPVEVDFAVAFNDICQTLAQRVQEPGVQFIVNNPYKQLLTRVDKGRLQQVITNFTTNAVKYTHQGHIKVGYSYVDGGIRMYCEDTGAGIPKEKQSIVFERFVKLNDFVQGTGLGLSICKSIADRCGGRIGIDSEGEGKGSTFWIWVPCEAKEITE